MTGAELLARLEAEGLALYEEGGALRARARRGVMTDGLRATIRAHKDDLLDVLVCREERAAIEGCPEWMDARAWRRVMDSSAARFLLSKGCEIKSVTLAGPGAVEQGRAA